jgi:DNA-binding LytR/AlgR family response regulator
MIVKILTEGTRTSLRKAQAVLRLAEQYGNERLEESCLRAILFDNYTYKSLKKILKEELDKRPTKTFSTKKAANIEDIAYIRSASNYASTMEVHL